MNDWDLIVHNRDNQNALDMVNAQHGSDCSPFPSTHPVNQFQDAVFICRNHLMTALNGGSYAEVVLTPAQLLDFSNTGTVQVSVSTLRTDNRDWLDFWISPFQEQLLLPSGGVPPDLQGPTKDAINIVIDGSVPTDAHVQEYRNFVESDFNGTGMSIETCVAPLGGVSASRRDPLQLTLSRSHVKLSVLVNGVACPLIDTNINDPGFSLGVVQLGHHSYAPDEATACNFPGCVLNTGAGAGNTYHWSTFSMSPAVPFTMLRGDMPVAGIQANTTHTVNFVAPAPANSFLRFSALAQRGSIKYSPNGGPWMTAQEQVQHGDGSDGINDSLHIAYFTPVPAGTTSVTFQAANSSAACCPWTIQDVSIWSLTQLGAVTQPTPTPMPSPSASSTPTPTPSISPSPTPMPSPSSSPIAINGAPCTVTINGAQRVGTCSGTFQPGS